MSDKNHTGESQLTFWLKHDIVARFDDAIEANGYKNRAEWFREKVRQEIEKALQK
jgi:metal-responsive CopG/Arc/MetJ family transcriptional regulator